MKPFQYAAPFSLPEALSLIEQHGSNSVILAGGTDLLVQMKQGLKSPPFILNIKSIPDLNTIQNSENSGIFIGSAVTHNRLIDHPLIQRKFGVLSEAAATIGSFQIRERGTIGGNLCNASPAADTVPALMCLGAKIRLESELRGERLIPVEEFFKAPRKTYREPDEILTGIQVPNMPPGTGASYSKLGRRKSLEIAIVGVASSLTLDDKGSSCKRARIGLVSVAPTPIRSTKAEDVLSGTIIDERVINEAGLAAQEDVSPLSDVRGSAEYRREMVNVLTRNAIRLSLYRAKQSLIEDNAE